MPIFVVIEVTTLPDRVLALDGLTYQGPPNGGGDPPSFAVILGTLSHCLQVVFGVSLPLSLFSLFPSLIMLVS